MITRKWEGFKYPQKGVTGENTPFAKEVGKRSETNDNGHNMHVRDIQMQERLITFISFMLKMVM